MDVEAPGDVRFLLVHHSASSNSYSADSVADQIRAFYRLHTGPAKGWPDVAYNFFADRYGGLWEGRAGSLAAPVKGDATGGSQGFALLCCLIGDHREVPPTPAATESLIALLAWLADEYGIDTSPTAQATFVSRGSNRHPPGRPVTTRTIAAHRDMSLTACPGDAAYALVRGELAARVSAVRSAGASPSAQATSTPTTIAPASDAATRPTSAGTLPAAPEPVPTPPVPGRRDNGVALAVGAGAVGVAAGALGLRLRSTRTTGRQDAEGEDVKGADVGTA